MKFYFLTPEVHAEFWRDGTRRRGHRVCMAYRRALLWMDSGTSGSLGMTYTQSNKSSLFSSDIRETRNLCRRRRASISSEPCLQDIWKPLALTSSPAEETHT